MSVIKRGIITLFSIVLLASLVSAYAPNVHLRLVDAIDDSQVDYVIANINIDDSVFTNNYVGEADSLNMYLPDGEYAITLKIEDLSTPGKDYHTTDNIVVAGEFTKDVVLYPVGTINGIVEDIDGNPISGAELSFECAEEIDRFPDKTDDFGFFAVKYASAGNCKVFAKYKGKTDSVDVIVERGSLNEINLKIDAKAGGKYNKFLIIAVAVILFFIIIRVIHGPSKEDKKADLKDSSSKRSDDIIKTLNKKEKEVVDYLFENGNKSNQANIRHFTGFPRTTLSRLLQSLESKNIVKIERHGKAVKVNLTKWFLSKE